MSLLSFLSGPVVPESQVPTALAVSSPSYGIVGSVVKLDGQRSSDGSVQGTRSGSDSSTSGIDLIASPSGSFSWLDLNRLIELRGTDEGTYRIISVVSPTQVQVVDAATDGSPVFSGGSNTSWAIQTELSYSWSFVTTPTGSRVTQEGFRQLDSSRSLVSFSPDVVGEYLIRLVVSNGVFESSPYDVRVSIRAILVPHARGVVPDGKWIWSYIRDVWSQVEGKEWFETLWSALIQISGAELLKTYQADFNKSIRDIQDLYQRRWLSYEPKLELVESDICIYVGNQEAGKNASTAEIGNIGRLLILSPTEFIIVQGSVYTDVVNHVLTITYDTMGSNIGDYILQNVNSAKNGYLLSTLSPVANEAPNKVMSAASFTFAFQSTTWSVGANSSLDYARRMSQYSPIIDELVPILDPRTGSSVSVPAEVGDYVHIPTGPNQGFYRIITKSGSFIIVDHAPPSDSDGSIPANVYRPLGFSLAVTPKTVTDSFSLPYSSGSSVQSLTPGRVVVVGGQAYLVLRTVIDQNQLIPLSIVTTNGGSILYGLSGLSWRIPFTLYSSSQNFQELGVSSGDLLVVDVSSAESSSTATLHLQVVGVTGNSIGVVLTDQQITSGAVPEIPYEILLELSSKLNIPTVSQDSAGNTLLSGDAKKFYDYLFSVLFARSYGNKKLCLSSLVFEIFGRTFTVHPRKIVRNHLIPVDDSLKSVPMLQDWISQPEWVQKNGKTYQIKNNKEFEIRGPPLSLVENSDFIIDSDLAFSGEMAFETGSNVVKVDDGHFVDLGIKSGDAFTVQSPITIKGSYFVASVLDQDTLILSSAIPSYALSTSVVAKVSITRKNSGRFLRFVMGGFTAANPAPDRLWAEVSLFDNNETVENNFGILVGLTRKDLEGITENINYRQAVAGLMYAYSGGSTVDLVRTGAQILLGLPFAESRGIVRSIENDYRLDITGKPVLGRIFIEDVDSQGVPQGTLRVYTFPIDLDSALAGVDTNPATGVAYAVGDIVEQFAALAKGVVVDDYINDPGFFAQQSPERQIQQLHAIRLRANDSVFSLSELSLVSTFLRRITPSYIKFFITSSAEYADNVSIVDVPIKRLSNAGNPLVDNPSLGLQTALMLDAKTWNGLPNIFLDDGVYWVRRSGRDLATTYSGSSDTATSATGGFLLSDVVDGLVTRPGDFLYIQEGPNQGRYEIVSVVSNNVVQVTGLPPKGFNTASGQIFAVVRPVSGLLREGSDAATTALNNVVTVSSGLSDDGVMPGDRLFITDGVTHSVHTITRVGPVDSEPALGALPAEPSLAAGEMFVLPAPSSTATGLTYKIYRDSLLASPFEGQTGTIDSDGSKYSNLTPELHRLLDLRDELFVYDSATPPVMNLFAVDPVNLVFSPVLPAGTYNVKARKRDLPGTPVGFDHLSFFDPTDPVEIGLVESDTASATCAIGDPNVTLQQWESVGGYAPFNPVTAGVKPGDLLALSNGGNSSVDVGYGSGVYPIVGVDPSFVTVSFALTSSDSSAWKILRRR